MPCANRDELSSNCMFFGEGGRGTTVVAVDFSRGGTVGDFARRTKYGMQINDSLLQKLAEAAGYVL